MNAKYVTAAKPKKGGAVFRAPVGTILPTDAESQLNEAFKGLGYISTDGVTNANSPTSNKLTAWGGDTVLNSTADRPDDFKFKLIEGINPEVLKTVYGDDNVEGNTETGMTVKVGSADPEQFAWVLDMVQKGSIAKRIVIPAASLSALEEIKYIDSDAVGYGVTISAVPDVAGFTHYEYFKKKAGAQA